MERIKTSRLSDYESEENRWIWQPYIAQGTVFLISGLGGKGKSFSSMAIAAAVTRGLPLPGDIAHLPPSNVLLSNLENHRKRMVRPRAEIVGADLDRIVLLEEDDRLTLTDDRLERIIVQDKIALAIIDPLQAHLPRGVSMNNAESIRPVFTHLAKVAERTNCGICLIGHVNKSNSASSDRLLGSADIYNSVLSVMLVGKIDKEQGISALVHHKSNMDELGASQAFRLSKQDGYEWLGECGATATDVLRDDDSCGDGGMFGSEKKIDFAKAIIQEHMSGEPLSSKELFTIAAKNGVSMATYRRARDELGMTRKHGSKQK